MVDASLYQTLFDALRTRSADELAHAAYTLLRMPIVVTDTAFVVIAKCPDKPLGDEQWDANRIGRQIEPRFLETFREDDHFAKYPQTSRPILIDWGHYERTPRLTALIRSEDTVVGFACALTTGCDVDPWHYEAMEIIAEAFSILTETEFGTRSRHLDFTTAYLYRLLSNTAVDDLDSIHALFVQQLPGPYRLLAARPRTPYDAPPEAAAKRAIERCFDSAAQVAYQNTLYVLVSDQPSKTRTSIEASLEAPGVVWGVSRAFNDISKFAGARWQIDSALRVGAATDPERCVHFFDDIAEDAVLDEITSRVPLSCAEPPALTALRAHDAENGTEYFATLESYLLNRRDRKATAQALHIHRNTLAYRLDRIDKMAGGEATSTYAAVYFALVRHAQTMGSCHRAQAKKNSSAEGGTR